MSDFLRVMVRENGIYGPALEFGYLNIAHLRTSLILTTMLNYPSG